MTPRKSSPDGAAPAQQLDLELRKITPTLLKRMIGRDEELRAPVLFIQRKDSPGTRVILFLVDVDPTDADALVLLCGKMGLIFQRRYQGDSAGLDAEREIMETMWLGRAEITASQAAEARELTYVWIIPPDSSEEDDTAAVRSPAEGGSSAAS